MKLSKYFRKRKNPFRKDAFPDALNMSFKEFKLRRDPNTPQITELIDYQQFCGLGGVTEETDQKDAFQRILYKMQNETGRWLKPFVLDVQKATRGQSRLFGLCRPDSTSRKCFGDCQSPTEDRDILIHCKMGGRSAKNTCSISRSRFYQSVQSRRRELQVGRRKLIPRCQRINYYGKVYG